MKWYHVALILIGVLFLTFRKQVYETGVEIIEYMKSLYDDIFKKWANARSLDWRLLRAFATVESNLKASAIGDDGRSIGLMQCQLLIGQAYAGVSDLTELYDPDRNVQAGSGYIADLMQKYDGNLDDVIQAYNLGETKFNKGITNPTYLAKVKKAYDALKDATV